MKRCASCGREVREGSRFCEGCGVDLNSHDLPMAAGSEEPSPVAPVTLLPAAERTLDADHEQVQATEVESWNDRRRRWVWPTIFALALASALGAGVFLYVTLEQTRDDLTARQVDLNQTSAVLDDTESELADTESALAATTDERDQLEGRVRSLKTSLRGVRGTLDKAQANLELQAGQISTLKTCLNGVSIAFDRVLRFDYRGAAAALQSVETPCNEAFALI
jgi:hypothetical protein